MLFWRISETDQREKLYIELPSSNHPALQIPGVSMNKSRLRSILIFAAGFVLYPAIDFSRHIISLAKGATSNPAVIAQAQQTTPTPQRWDYRVIKISPGGVLSGGSGGEKELIRLGEQGYDVFGM